MKKFDDYMADMLDKESNFPNQRKNWNALSKRLEAFELGSSGPKIYRQIWQGIALAALVGGALYYAQTREQKVIIASQKELLEMSKAVAAAQQSELETLSNSVEEKTRMLEAFERLSMTQQALQRTLANMPRYQEVAPVPAQANLPGYPSFGLQNYAPRQYNLMPSDYTISAKTVKPFIWFTTPTTVQKPAENQAALVATSPQPPDSIHTLPAENPLEPKINSLKIKAGVYGIVGLITPEIQGVSLIKGQGISLEYKLGRTIWLSASTEWSNIQVQSKAFPQQLMAQRDTFLKPFCQWWGFHNKCTLEEVTGTLQSRQFGLGMRYEPAVNWWIKPTIRATYQWARTAPTQLTYKFKKPETQSGFQPKPEY
ncbi:MAG: hypothetical protein JNJ57_01915, partial [Saprospiraceae bacterium]|nr:hypothetical protein [Saprospiraceae bacterium]